MNGLDKKESKISPPVPYDILLFPLAAPPAVPSLHSAHLHYTLLLLLLLHQLLQHLQRILENIIHCTHHLSSHWLRAYC